MFRSVFQGLAALSFIAALSLASPVRAATPEGEALGLEIGSTLLDAADFKSVIARAMTEESASMGDFSFRPEWKQLLVDSMIEETEHDIPALKRLFGKSFADNLTVEELRAGVTIMRDPAMQAAIAAAAADRPTPTTRPQRATEKVINSPAGRAFLDRLSHLDSLMGGLENDFIAEIIPGAFRRFADKAEASEAARNAAH